ncbi:zinc-binding dehydrogenase [Glutamicibacter creatinolyticus]
MRAAVIDVPGPAESIAVREVPIPRPQPDEVLVRAEFSCVNHVDTFVRSGAYATELPSPFIIGRDVAGTVEALGESVTGFSVGDPVWSNSLGYDRRQGSFAEFCVVPAARLFTVPQNVADLRGVVALSHAMTTAWLGLGRSAPLAAGQSVFIGGAAGAVGSAAVQFACARSARVIASAAPADHSWVRGLGADTVLDYARPDLIEAVASHVAEGAAIWWDTSGHQQLAQLIPALANRGTVLISAGLQAEASIPVGALYTRDVSVKGFAVSNAGAEELSAAAAALNELLATRELKYRVDRELPLEQAGEAHRLVEAGGLHGKVLVRLRG